MIRKLIVILTLTLPTVAVCMDLEGYYITAKGGLSKSMDTGEMNWASRRGNQFNLENGDLGTGYAYGLSFGKFVTDNIRLELEGTKRTGFDTIKKELNSPGFSQQTDVDTTTLLINGFYDFQSFSMANTSIKPYLGIGMGISRNVFGPEYQLRGGSPDNTVTYAGKTTGFAFKLSAGLGFSLTEEISVDLNYQYVNLGALIGSTNVFDNFGPSTLGVPPNGGNFTAQELMVGMRFKL